MKYKIPSVIIALFAAATAVCLGAEQATSLDFTPDDHYAVGTSQRRAQAVHVGTGGLWMGAAKINHVQVSLTAAQIIAMYTTPVVLVAAPGTGKTIAVSRCIFTITRTSTAFTGGGANIIQYDSTANGAGTNACDSTLASTVVTGASGTSVSLRNGAVISDSAALQNKGIYISNATAVYAAGTGTATVDVWYTLH
jgi:hypothetical protein